MSQSIKGTRTEKNLMAAFASESIATNRYLYFAKAAKKEGYEYIADVFTQVAKNEKAHAEILFEYFESSAIEISATFPSGPISDTRKNLEAAIAGESMSWTLRYPDLARVAQQEGFPKIANTFESIAIAEKYHEERFQKLLNSLINKEVFKKEVPTRWHCMNCGYISDGTEAPRKCPACQYPKAFFEEV